MRASRMNRGTLMCLSLVCLVPGGGGQAAGDFLSAAGELQRLVWEVPTGDLLALYRTREAAGDAAGAAEVRRRVEAMHLAFAQSLRNCPPEAEPLRRSFERLPEFYNLYSAPRGEEPDPVFLTLAALPEEQRELPVIMPEEDAAWEEGNMRERGQWRMIRHVFDLPGQPVSGWVQIWGGGYDYLLNGHNYGWHSGMGQRYDLTEHLRPGRNVFLIADAFPDKFIVVRGGVLLEDGTVVPLLSGQERWEVAQERYRGAQVAMSDPERMDEAGGTWHPAKLGDFETSWRPRPPLEVFSRDEQVTLRVQGPHWAFGRPLAGGPVRTLLLGPFSAQSDTVELARRLDLDFTTARLGRHNWLPDEGFLLKADGEYDLYILGRVGISGEVAAALRKQVHEEGKGLVVVADLNRAGWERQLGLQEATRVKADEIITGVPLYMCPPFVDGRELWTTLYEAGEGRVAIITYPDSKILDQIWRGPFSHNGYLLPNTATEPGARPFHMDYLLGLVAKAARWAAGREQLEWRVAAEPLFPITPTRPADGRAPRERPLSLEVELARLPETAEVVLDLQVRDLEGRVHHTAVTPVRVSGRQATLSYSLPELPEGTYFADLRCLHEGQVLDWHTHLLVTVAGPRLLQRVELKPDPVRPGESCEVTAYLRAEVPAGSSLGVTVEDGALRRLLTVPLRVEGRRAVGSFTVPAETTPLTRVLVDLRIPTRWERQEVTLSVRVSPTSKYFWQIWGPSLDEGPSYKAALSYQQMGMDATIAHINRMAGAERARRHAETGIRCAPFSWTLTDLGQSTYTRAFGLHQRIAELEPLARYGVALGNLGDDTGIRRIRPEDPEHVRAWRRWLEDKFGSVAEMNRRLGTRFESFAEAPVLTEQQLRDEGVAELPLVMLTRRFLADGMIEVARWARDRIQEIDPEIPTGPEGMLQYSLAPFDWETFPEGLRYLCAYPWEWIAALPRFAEPDSIVGSWVGSYTDHERAPRMSDYFTWYLALNGYNASFTWHAGHSPHSSGPSGMAAMTAADGRPLEALMSLGREVRTLKDGVWELLEQAGPRPSPVAVYYSYDSVVATHFTGRPLLPESEFAQRGFWSLLEDLGYSPYLAGREELLAGDLLQRGIRALMLPYCRALSEAERQALLAYAEAGGLVIADVRPGELDEWGRPVPEEDALLTAFGVAYTGPPQAEVAARQVTRGGEVVEVPMWRADAATAATTKVAGDEGVTVWMERNHGQGKLLLLNCTLAGYCGNPKSAIPGMTASYYLPDTDNGRRAAALRRLIGGDLADQGIVPPGEVRVNGTPTPVVTRAWGAPEGPAYFGVLRGIAAPGAEPLEVNPPGPAQGHVYETLTGRYLGTRDGQSVKVSPELGEAALLAVLPYRVEGVRLTPEGPAQRGESLRFHAELRVTGGAAGSHVLRVVRRDPQGRVVELAQRTVRLQDGRGQFETLVGAGDTAGQWEIIAYDVATGIAGRATYEVGG